MYRRTGLTLRLIRRLLYGSWRRLRWWARWFLISSKNGHAYLDARRLNVCGIALHRITSDHAARRLEWVTPPRVVAVRSERELPRPLDIDRMLLAGFADVVFRVLEPFLEAAARVDLRPALRVPEAALVVFLRLDAVRVPELAFCEADFVDFRRNPEPTRPAATATARRLPVPFLRPERRLLLLSPSSRASAVSREMILLKLLLSPRAV